MIETRPELVRRLLFMAPQCTLRLSVAAHARKAMEQQLLDHPVALKRYYDRVQTFCFFVSLARSGHSLMAHLLSAHPEVVVSDELDALQLVKDGMNREQVLALIKYQDLVYARRKRAKSGYSYLVENKWQNQFRKRPTVMGDAKGGLATNIIGTDPQFVEVLRERLDMPLRAIVHLRNPFDMLSTRALKGNLEIEGVVERFERKVRLLDRSVSAFRRDELYVQRHEDVIADPAGSLSAMYEFLGVKPFPEVVGAAADRVWSKPQSRRNFVEWTPKVEESLTRILRSSVLLGAYDESR